MTKLGLTSHLVGFEKKWTENKRNNLVGANLIIDTHLYFNSKVIQNTILKFITPTNSDTH